MIFGLMLIAAGLYSGNFFLIFAGLIAWFHWTRQ